LASPLASETHFKTGVVPEPFGNVDRPVRSPRDRWDHHARPRSAQDVWDDLQIGFRDNATDFAHVYTAPFRIDGRSALWLGGVLAVGGLIYAWDSEIHAALKRNEFESPYRAVRDTGEFFEPLGYQGFLNQYLLGAYAVGYFAGIGPVRTVTGDILRSFLISAPGKSLANELAGRRGPKVGEGAHSFVFADGRSFPSGHSLAIATVARVVTYHAEFWPVDALAYTAMGTVLLQRVTSDAHWPSDAYFGALYGWFVTDALLDRNAARTEGMQWGPVTTPSRSGLGIQICW
jgi:membrane-associated phospholipid phosphatase